MITQVVVVIHSVYHWIPISLHQLVETRIIEVTSMELNIEHPLTVTGHHNHGHHNHDVPYAVCHTSNCTAVYIVPAKYTCTCPSGWKREYYGYLMGQYYNYNSHQFTCVDTAFKPVVESSADRNGLLFYFVEGRLELFLALPSI